jgi:transposase
LLEQDGSHETHDGILAWGMAADNRLFVEAVLYRYRAGIPWRELPERFSDWKIVYQRFNRCAKEGSILQVAGHQQCVQDGIGEREYRYRNAL